MKFGSNGILK